MKNKEKVMIFVVFGSVLLIMISISYAYFTANFQNLGDRETSITAATMGSLKLTASAPTYTSGNQYPGDMAIQKFEVEPVTKGVGVYEIDLTGVIDETIFGTDVEVSLYKVLDNSEITITEGELTVEEYHPCKKNSTSSEIANYELEKINPSFLITSSQDEVSLRTIDTQIICDEGYEGYGVDDVITKYSRIDTLNENGNTAVYNDIFINGNQILLQEEFEVIEDNGTLKIRENSTSTSYPKYTFYLVYNYKNNGLQDAQMEQSFSGTVSGKIIQEKTFSPVNGADYIMNLAKTGNIPGISYDEITDSVDLNPYGDNNFFYFNDQMPFLADGYTLYYDHASDTSQLFDTLEECNQQAISTATLSNLDGTVECKMQSESNKYYMEATGYVSSPLAPDAATCNNLLSDISASGDYNVSCQPYSSYVGWKLIKVQNGKMMLAYLGEDEPQFSGEADLMVADYIQSKRVELNPNTLIVGGNGSKEKPYLLAIDDMQIETGQG